MKKSKRLIKYPEGEKLNKQITLRFSEEEWETIEKAFEVSGHSQKATFLRLQLLTWFNYVKVNHIQVISERNIKSIFNTKNGSKQ